MLIETMLAIGGAVGLGVLVETCRIEARAKRRAKPIEAKELDVEPTPPAQGAYRTPGVGSYPYQLAQEREERFPPITSECPACGASLKLSRCPAGHYSVKSVGFSCQDIYCGHSLKETALELVFCQAGQQTKGCNTKAPHLHQNCRRCGWQGLARPKKDIVTCTE